MNSFKVFQHPVKGIEIVKQGFSWPALIFSWIWMLFHQMWAIAIGWFSLNMLIGFLQVLFAAGQTNASQITSLICFGLYICLWFYPGFVGNQWREERLARRGYSHINTVEAETADGALAKHHTASALGAYGQVAG